MSALAPTAAHGRRMTIPTRSAAMKSGKTPKSVASAPSTETEKAELRSSVLECTQGTLALRAVDGSDPATVRRALGARHRDQARGDQVPLTAMPVGGSGGRGSRERHLGSSLGV